MRNQLLPNVRLMFKAEAGLSTNTSISTALDPEINWLLYTKQAWLASEFDWPFLRESLNVAVAINTQYVTLPAINWERATSIDVEVLYNNIYQPLEYGIGPIEYNTSNFALNQQMTPIQRWQLYGQTQFEVWPVGPVAQTIRFWGQTPLTDITTKNGAGVITGFDDTKTIDLDDQMVALFATAEWLLRKKDPAAQAKLAVAQKRMADIRASYPKREQRCTLHGSGEPPFRNRRFVPIVTVAP